MVILSPASRSLKMFFSSARGGVIVPSGMVLSGTTNAKINLLNSKPLEQRCSQFYVASTPIAILLIGMVAYVPASIVVL